MKKFIITEDEKRRILGLHEGFKKGVLSEQNEDYTGGQYYTKVEGPYKDAGYAGTGDLYIMRLEKSLCRWDQKSKAQAFGDNENLYRGAIRPMTGATCGEGFTTIPGGKFYVQGVADGKIQMHNVDSKFYETATNMGQGYNTAEEAKKAISVMFNPKGSAGRQVIKGTDPQGGKGKLVVKYDKDGTIKGSKEKYTTSGGTKTVQRTQSGL